MAAKKTVKDALKKCAVGQFVSEIAEEYVRENNEMVLTKKKVIKKQIPPDIKAVKMLMDEEGVSYLSDDELISEREKLKNLLEED